MPALALLLLVGTAIGFWLPAPVWGVSGMPLVAIVSLSYWISGWRGVFLLAGVLIATFEARLYRAEVIPAELEGASVLVRGQVDQFPAAEGVSLELAAVDGQEWPLRGRRIRLTLYDPAIRPAAGEVWQLLVRLKAPHGFRNTFTSDRRLWMFTRGITATGYVPVSGLNRRLNDAKVEGGVIQLRAALRSRLEKALPNSPVLPYLVGLVVGARDGLSKADRKILRRTGTSHLLAISGLHVGLVALVVWWLVVALVSLSGMLTGLRVPQFIAPALSAAAAFFYAVLAGLTVPTQRAFVMVLLVLLLAGRLRIYDPLTTVAVALTAVLFIQPSALLAPGSWLSFLAVVLLFVWVTRPAPASGWQRLTGLVQTQWMLGWALAGPVLLAFGELSLVSLPANLLAIPVFSLLIVPSLLLGMTAVNLGWSFGVTMIELAAMLLEYVLVWLKWLATSDWAVQSFAMADPVVAVLSISGFLLLALPPAMRLLPAGCVLVLVAAWWGSRAPTHPQLYVFDVGQGLAVLIRSEEGDVLYDTGPGWPGGDAGEQVVVPVLKSLGVQRLDALVVSHEDNDHSGGLRSVMNVFPVDDLYTQSEGDYFGQRSHACRRGDAWKSGSLTLRFLHPRNASGWSENNASCVLEVVSGDAALLLPGDIEADAESVLLGRGLERDYQLVVAPHHGSSTSSTQAFINELLPAAVLFATGYRNRWGFPEAAVVGRWRTGGACILNLASTGGIWFDWHPEQGLSLRQQAASAASLPWVLHTTDLSECRMIKPL